MLLRRCENCRKEFKIRQAQADTPGWGRFCSMGCRNQGKFNSRYNGGLELVTKTCLSCGKGFDLIKRITRLRPAKYCSRKCVNLSKRTGKSPKTVNGYLYLWKPDHPQANCDGYVAEHRLIMEKSIGRHIEPEEIVHHINHTRNDNRIENLQLVASNSEHNLLHSKEITQRMKRYWTPENRLKKSEAIKELRKNRFWSTKLVD